ncbi:MAG TPA: methylamine utilization protein [Thermoanaerobaculia bacterium]|nr:methylamine utilization protein [Thermoanaerobaculia bacterium]
MRRSFLTVLLVFLSLQAAAATLTVDVRNARGVAMPNAVVYAIRDGRESMAPARRRAVMDQKNRMFVPHVLPVQTGTAVEFPNSDDIRHQVYSFSGAKTFQLPLYTGTPANPIVFDKPGVATLGCSIHDRMSAYIVVVDTPHFAATGKEGRVILSNLSAGRYVVHVWHSELNADPAPLTLGSSDQRELAFVVR